MKYIFECNFIDKPECDNCRLSFYKMSYDGESEMYCAALGDRSKCPDDGYRKDCPLKSMR